MKTETFTDKTAFLEALTGKKAQRRRRVPEIGAQHAVGHSTQRSPATGLSTLLLRGWNVEWNSTMQIRLWRAALDTGWFDDEKEACDCAKALAQSGKLRVEKVVG